MAIPTTSDDLRRPALPPTKPSHDRKPPAPAGPFGRQNYPPHLPLPHVKAAMDPVEPLRPSTPDKIARSSFSSVRENDSGMTQTFTSSKVSSYLAHANEEAILDDLPSPKLQVTMGEGQFMPPLTHPNSRLHNVWYPVDTFKGWKQINVRGKTASRSFSDLQALHMSWSTPPPATPKVRGKHIQEPGRAPIERLPLELLGSIIELLVIEIPPNGVSRRNVDLMHLLLTSRTVHAATLNTLYKHITIPHSRIFRKFLSNIQSHQALGTIVRRLDFSHFNPSTLFVSAVERAQTRNLTSETLASCLELTPHLQEFLAQEHIDDDLSPEVLRKLFFGLPRLRAIDLAGCSSVAFRQAFSSVVSEQEWPDTLSITRLSLHKCLTLPSSVFETILPRMTNLTHLDLAATRVTDAALMSIPETARLTHLNIAKCKLLSAKTVIQFLSTHPAAKTLVYLSVATDARSHQLLDAGDVTKLLSILPSTLRSLSLKGSKMNDTHLPALRSLTAHLEELALGRGLDVVEASKLFVPDEAEQKKEKDGAINGEAEQQQEAEAAPASILRYLDLSDLWGSELSLSDLFSSQCSLLRAGSAPLEVIEVSEESFKHLAKNPKTVERIGWSLREFGSRSWLVKLEEHRPRGDRGQRWWKMGADSWGMRKIPVARAEVGGMYGSFMFGRKL